MDRDIWMGKDIETGEWVRGRRLPGVDGSVYIVCASAIDEYESEDGKRSWLDTIEDYHSVDPSTLSQYTGKKDIDQTGAFENHIIEFTDTMDQTVIGIIKYGEYSQDGSGGEYGPSKCLGFYIERIKVYPADWMEDEDVFIPRYDRTRSLLDINFKILGYIFDDIEY
jgi:hypothetical protein